MSFTDDVVDVAVALGKGVYSVGEDIVLGVQRTGEGLGLGDDGRMADIGYENRAMVSLLADTFKYGVIDQRSPLYRTIVPVLEHYYSFFPDQVIRILAKQAGVGMGYTVGRMVIGRHLATEVAKRIAIAVAASSAYKQIAVRLGLSVGVTTKANTYIGVTVGSLMAQGLMQRSSHAASRLKMKSPTLYLNLMRNGDLQLLYFLLEKPLEQYVQAISTAENDNAQFQSAIKRKYTLN
jgi:hypothetical protein